MSCPLQTSAFCAATDLRWPQPQPASRQRQEGAVSGAVGYGQGVHDHRRGNPNVRSPSAGASLATIAGPRYAGAADPCANGPARPCLDATHRWQQPGARHLVGRAAISLTTTQGWGGGGGGVGGVGAFLVCLFFVGGFALAAPRARVRAPSRCLCRHSAARMVCRRRSRSRRSFAQSAAPAYPNQRSVAKRLAALG